MKQGKKQIRLENSKRKKANREQALRNSEMGHVGGSPSSSPLQGHEAVNATSPPTPGGGSGPDDREPARNVLFEATIHPGRKARSADWMNRLDIDRVPDPKGQVRALLTTDDLVRLLDQGFEIRLSHAHRIGPLNPALVETDESVRRWLDDKLRGFVRPKETKGI